MDKDVAKLLLESMRAQDAEDPIYAEALREAAADPELAAWFENLQRYDAAIGAKLRGLEVPADVRGHILMGYRAAEPAPLLRMPRIWFVPTALAAALAISLVSWHLLVPPQHSVRAMEMQAIAYTKDMPALQFVCFDAAEVTHWVNQQPTSQQVGLKLPTPDGSMRLKMIGASMTKWGDHPVVMLCLQDGRRMAMLYIMSGDSMPEMAEGTTETMQHGDWVVRATKVNGQVRLLAAKGTPNDLDFAMPFGQGAS